MCLCFPRPGTSDVIRCVLKSLRVSVCLTNLALTEPLFGSFIQWKKSSDDELSSTTSSSRDDASLQLAVEGEGFFNSII